MRLRALRLHEERGAAGLLRADHGFICTSRIGTPSPGQLRNGFVWLCKAAGLGHWHPHEARHSAASMMLAQGVLLQVVSAVLGHSSI
ncbi:MAG: tyrosine-type recombinase/integrase [Acidimicrobiales bacterium]